MCVWIEEVPEEKAEEDGEEKEATEGEDGEKKEGEEAEEEKMSREETKVGDNWCQTRIRNNSCSPFLFLVGFFKIW